MSIIVLSTDFVLLRITFYPYPNNTDHADEREMRSDLKQKLRKNFQLVLTRILVPNLTSNDATKCHTARESVWGLDSLNEKCNVSSTNLPNGN